MAGALRACRGLSVHLGQQRALPAVAVVAAAAWVPAPVPARSAATRAAAARSANMSTQAAECEVLSEVQGAVGIATLNRPRALNALSTGMVEALGDLYRRWDADPGVACIVLKGAGDKAFCAGGDVKTVVQQGLAGKFQDALRFFTSEYRTDHLISQLRKPHVALIDGICFGGGVGLSVLGTFRVATERTVFAMPECAIGLYPDVGGSWFLPRLPGGLGLYLALTGARINGVDVMHAGIATHYIPSTLLPEVHQAIVGLGATAADAGKLGDLLASFEQREALPEGQLAAIRHNVDFCFGGKQSVEEVYEACERSGGQWGFDMIGLMSKGSPTSQKLTFEQLRRGAALPDLAACLHMENCMVHHMVQDVGSDFYTGVSAALITRNNNPAWVPASLKDVRPEHVARFFEPLPPEQELQLPSPPPSPRGKQSRL